MFKRLDRSQFLIRLLQRLSGILAKQRGLPIIIGLILVVSAFIVQLINMSLNLDSLELVHVVLQNLGIILALVGLLLAEPLGQ